jgi:hypothetical protein
MGNAVANWCDGSPVIQGSVGVGGLEYVSDGQSIDVISTAGMARYLQTNAQLTTAINNLMAHILRPLGVAAALVVDVPDLMVGGACSYGEDPGFRTTPNVPYLDPHCKARWRFETGDGIRDSISGFALSQGNGSVPQSNHVEGSTAQGFSSPSQQYLYRSNANMPSWYPFKSGGSMVGAVTFFMYQTNTNSSTTQIDIGGVLRLDTYQRYTYWKWGNQSQGVLPGGNLVDNQWYFCAINIDGPNGHSVIYRWPLPGGTGGHTLINLDQTPVTDATGDLILGGRGPLGSVGYFMDGAIDDFCVFDRLLTLQDMWNYLNGYFHGKYPKDQDYQKFHDDPDCVGLYLFKPGMYERKKAEIGTDLTPSNANDSQNSSRAHGMKEAYGVWCKWYGGNPGYTITDADLPTGFPFKNGDTGKKMTVCLWYKQSRGYSGSNSYGEIIRKHYSVDNNSFKIWSDVNTQTLKIGWGYGSGYYTLDTGISIIEYQPYHIAVELDAINNSIYVRVYDFYANTTYTYSTTVVNNLSLNSETLYILDGGGTADAYINCLCFFKRLLTDAEIDAIRDGTYNYVQTRNLATDCDAVVDASAQARIFRPFSTSCQMSAGGVYGRPRKLITQAGGNFQEWLGSRNINTSLLPTSADGLLSGALWVDNGKIKVVP